MTIDHDLGSHSHPMAETRWERLLSLAAAVTVLVLLPVTMVVANKSAPLVLGIGAALVNASALMAAAPKRLLARYAVVARSGLGLLLATLAAWSVASLLWSIDPAMTRRGLVEALPEFLFGWALAAAWPLVIRDRDLALLRAGVLAAAGLIVFESISGMPLHHLFGARAEAYDMKRSAVPIVLLAWPAMAWCIGRGERAWAVALALAAGLAGVFAHSAASVVAVCLSAAVYGAAQPFPRSALAGLATVLFGLLVVTPWGGTVADRAISPSVRELLSGQHATHRIAIWTAFERHIRERSLAGHGFDTSFRVADQVEGAGATGKEVIDNLHPHDVLLQIWVEFGLIGAIGAAVALVFVVTRLGRLEDRARAARLGFITSAGVVSLVGLNAWAPWWLAVIAVCLVAFRTLREFDSLGPGQGTRPG